jgi:oligopeptidase A
MKWRIEMTLEKATLPVPQFDQIQLADLKKQIEQAIQQGQKFLADLTEVPESGDGFCFKWALMARCNNKSG